MLIILITMDPNGWVWNEQFAVHFSNDQIIK